MNIYIIMLLILILFILITTNTFFDIKSIIKKYIKVFKKDIGITVIFILILAISIISAFTYTVSVNMIESLYIILAILISSFFTMIGTIQNNKNEKIENYEEAKKETYTIILFQILQSVSLLIILFLYEILQIKFNEVMFMVSSSVIYFLTLSIMVNILILMKRINVLLLKSTS